MIAQGDWYDEESFWELVEPLLANRRLDASAGEQVEQIERLLGLEKGERVLDLCCGHGRHSLALADRGYAVTGVDRTARYIAAARREAGARNLRAEFVVSDMREYCQPDAYDAVLNLFGSFGYFADEADDRRVVENMYASLKPGGHLLIETAGKEILARGFPEREWSEVDDTLLLSEKRVAGHWERMETRWIAVRGPERIEHRVSIRCYSAVELSALLRACGFPEVRVYGALQGAPYDQRAERLVVVGRK